MLPTRRLTLAHGLYRSIQRLSLKLNLGLSFRKMKTVLRSDFVSVYPLNALCELAVCCWSRRGLIKWSFNQKLHEEQTRLLVCWLVGMPTRRPGSTQADKRWKGVLAKRLWCVDPGKSRGNNTDWPAESGGSVVSYGKPNRAMIVVLTEPPGAS